MRLKLDDIEFLALEGGGGKGFAYLGAIDALNDMEYANGSKWNWNKIKGYSGSSAGAITSMLLSIGIYKKKDIEDFMEKNIKPESFFDPPNPRYIPQPGGFKEGNAYLGGPDLLTRSTRLILVYLIAEMVRIKKGSMQIERNIGDIVNETIKHVFTKTLFFDILRTNRFCANMKL